MEITFWGVRGSIASPRSDCMKYGGNTTCLEIQGPNQELLIFDAGTGIRGLGIERERSTASSGLNLTLFFTHFHWDHIQGLPYFSLLHNKNNQISLAAGVEPAVLEETLGFQMSAPFFPLSLDSVAAQIEFLDIRSGPLTRGAFEVRSFALNHPQGATGYRIESDHKAVVFATDFEHGHAESDKTLRNFSAGAELLIFDSQYSPEEYEKAKGWGHSTWLEATSVAREAGVKNLVLFHHHPSRSDRDLERILELARQHFENTSLAREGVTVKL